MDELADGAVCLKGGKKKEMEYYLMAVFGNMIEIIL